MLIVGGYYFWAKVSNLFFWKCYARDLPVFYKKKSSRSEFGTILIPFYKARFDLSVV